MNRTLTIFTVFIACSLLVSGYSNGFVNSSALTLEDEWFADPLHLATPLAGPAINSYSPIQMKTAYGLPSSGGAGATIAIIIAYHSPNIINDLTVFSNQFGLPTPNAGNFELAKMDPNIPVDNDWSLEAALDVEWSHAIAPNAKILLVEAKSNRRDHLLSAVDYARSRSDVVAISMSWGGSEPSNPLSFDTRLVSNYGAVFFAATGDDGSGVMWPSSSANVVAVGGTTLNLYSDGTVISETGWSGSGGGISAYEDIPSYQISFGLSTSKRTVPDVSYNADPQTGVAVYYDSGWYTVGGTSAGAPQWAAIHALGRSSSHMYLYQKAKLAYSSYFRDITSGSNGDYTATQGYDYVTGLGSPLTINFASTLDVFPNSGPPGAVVMLDGNGFSPSSTVSLSYLNPITSNWIPVSNSIPTTLSGQFEYSLATPDLMQGNPAGENPPLFSNIVFRAQDNTNGFTMDTLTPYREWHRGLTQVGTITATGLFGNNTNLASTLFTQIGQTIPVSGTWFNPGSITFLFDGTINLGTAPVDATGSFNTAITVPASATSGPHNIVIEDANSNFIFTIRRLPILTADYDGNWHTSNYIIPINTDGEGVSDMYYRINNGLIQNVSFNGQPLITSENINNALEYWGNWTSGGISVELPHSILSGIKLDKTPPEGSISIDNDELYTSSTSVTLSLTAFDATSGVFQVRYSDDGLFDTELWEVFAAAKSWTLTFSDGLKTVYYQIMDNAGLTSTYSDSIYFDSSPPQGSIKINNGASYTNTAFVTLSLTVSDSISGSIQMRFSNDDVAWSDWEPYQSSKSWILENTDGLRTVFVQFKNIVGLVSIYNASITLDTIAPIANAGQSQTVVQGAPVIFDAGNSTDNFGIVEYVWDFGDGSQGSGVTTTHVYSSANTYMTKVTVVDEAQNTASATVAIAVEAPSPTPTITPTPQTSPSPSPTPSPSPSESPVNPSATPQIPEFPLLSLLAIVVLSVFGLVTKFRKELKPNK